MLRYPWRSDANDARRICVVRDAPGLPPWKPKKLVASRFAAVLGIDKWKTPFGAWCEIVRVAEEEFVENKYTVAGKVVEPKVVKYLKDARLFPNLLTSAEYKVRRGMSERDWDLYPADPIFGGAWDAAVMKGDAPAAIIEIKTSSRPQDWLDGPPQNYIAQAAYYAYLSGAPSFAIVAVLLKPEDYDDPRQIVVTDENTLVYEFDTDEVMLLGMTVEEALTSASVWWQTFVEAGVSPAFDEKRDKAYLDILRTGEYTDPDLADLLYDVEKWERRVAGLRSPDLDEAERALAEAKDRFKQAAIAAVADDSVHEVFMFPGGWCLKRTVSRKLDEKALAKEGGLYEKLMEQFGKETVSYRLTKKGE